AGEASRGRLDRRGDLGQQDLVLLRVVLGGGGHSPGGFALGALEHVQGGVTAVVENEVRPVGEIEDPIGGPPVLFERLALPREHRHYGQGLGVPEPTSTAAAASSWVEKILQLAHRTSAPRATRVSMSTAVWTVMCRLPAMRAPVRGADEEYSSRSAISPGISRSARRIWCRPASARVRSATLKSAEPSTVPP